MEKIKSKFLLFIVSILTFSLIFVGIYSNSSARADVYVPSQFNGYVSSGNYDYEINNFYSLPFDFESNYLCDFNILNNNYYLYNMTPMVFSSSDLNSFSFHFPLLEDTNTIDFYSYYHYQIWDEEWEKGVYSNSTGLKVSGDRFRCKNKISISPNTQYFFYIGYNSGGQVYYYDNNENFLSYAGFSRNSVITTPNNAYYMTFNLYSEYGNGSIYRDDISIYYGSQTKLLHTYYNNLVLADSSTFYNIDDLRIDYGSVGESPLSFNLCIMYFTTPIASNTIFSYFNMYRYNNNYYSFDIGLNNFSNNLESYNVFSDNSLLNVYEDTNLYFYYVIWGNNTLTNDYLNRLYSLNDYIDTLFGSPFNYNCCPYVSYFSGEINNQSSYTSGYNNGYNVGYSDASSNVGYSSYQNGYSKGYSDGLSVSSADYGFKDLIFNIFDIPLMILENLFSFSLFDTLAWSFVATIIMLGFVVWLIRKFFR